MRIPALVFTVLVIAHAAAAQTISVDLDKRGLGLPMGTSIWPKELDGNLATREGLAVRLGEHDQLLYLPFRVDARGRFCYGAWVDPWDRVGPKVAGEPFVASWTEEIQRRFTFVVQGVFRYIEMHFDVPAGVCRMTPPLPPGYR